VEKGRHAYVKERAKQIATPKKKVAKTSMSTCVGCVISWSNLLVNHERQVEEQNEADEVREYVNGQQLCQR
jgi:hypothetical protein